MTIKVSITPNGRLSLPADVQMRMGIAGDQSLLIEETPNGLILRTLPQAIAHAQALMKKYTAGMPDVTVDDFLAHRTVDCGE